MLQEFWIRFRKIASKIAQKVPELIRKHLSAKNIPKTVYFKDVSGTSGLQSANLFSTFFNSVNSLK